MTSAIRNLLVANRGEIACRVMRTASRLGVRTVAVYSEADADAPHVKQADEAVMIGPAPVGESYLNIERILEAAKVSGADAIHPGYGFLSENEAFADACVKAGLIFVGPPASAVALMGNKAEAKRRMIAADVPCVPGYEGRDQSEGAFVAAAEAIGFPVMVKAAAGGGGRGMRLVDNAGNLPEALKLARSEAETAFGSGELILEKAIVEPRHVEIQVFADSHGNVVHLGERDCSVQRRHQKVIEEAPSPAVDESLREHMGAAAVEAALAIDYRGAGTVEFLLDQSGDFYFLEMNTRLQVEHPVTEMIVGRDLVELQIAVAQGEPLGFSQQEVEFFGHAMEVRLYAEDPAQDFLPMTGDIALWAPSSGEGIRIDAGIVTGQTVSPYYDPMLVKVIAWGETRDIARRRLIDALGGTALFGPATNRDFLISALRRDRFAAGQATTAFIEQEFGSAVTVTAPALANAAVAAVLRFLRCRERAFSRAGRVSAGLLNWSSRGPIAHQLRLREKDRDFDLSISAAGNRYQVSMAGKAIEIEVVQIDGASARLQVDKRTCDFIFHADEATVFVATPLRSFTFMVIEAGATDEAAADDGGTIRAPMHGKMNEILVGEGDDVTVGDKLAVLEAMKMQHQITATSAGKVAAIHVKSGDQVGVDDMLFEIIPTEQ